MSECGLAIDEIQIGGVDNCSEEFGEQLAGIDRTNSRTACISPKSQSDDVLQDNNSKKIKKRIQRQSNVPFGKTPSGDHGTGRVSPLILLIMFLLIVVAFLLGTVLGFIFWDVVRAPENERCHVDGHGQLVSANGTVVLASSADTIVAPDGTLRIRGKHETNSSNRLVAADRLESWSTLVDLPGQSLYFLERLQRITLYIDSNVQMFSISGFKWVNISYMELQLGQDGRLLIAGGKAFLRDMTSGKVKHATAPASEPQCGRRLHQDVNQGPRVYSWTALVAKYHKESDVASRRLALEADSFVHMLEWFGALISSEVAVEEAQSQATEALDSAYCDFNTRGLECDAYESSLNPQPPKLSATGLTRFTVREASGAYRNMFGEAMLFYFDLSDWALGRSRQARHKIAARITVPDEVSSNDSFPSWIDVTEVVGSKTYRYELPHPGAWPEMYNLDANNLSFRQDGGLSLATRVLESRHHQVLKSNCRIESFHPEADRASGLHASSPDSAEFDCTTGTFTWDIGGWRVESSANGTILAFIAADADDASRPLRFHVDSIADGNDDEVYPELARAFETRSLFLGCELHNNSWRMHDMGRRLGFLQDAQAWVSGTNWCGHGTDWVNTVCPTPENSDDYDADRACRRHDHCARFEDYWFYARLACSCDKDLQQAASHNWAISSIYASYGLSRKWGCYTKESHRRWGSRRRWWWHLETAYGETVRYGFDRYSGSVHDYGYSAKPKSCPDDLF